jgi:hypothetical protein
MRSLKNSTADVCGITGLCQDRCSCTGCQAERKYLAAEADALDDGFSRGMHWGMDVPPGHDAERADDELAALCPMTDRPFGPDTCGCCACRAEAGRP